MFNLGGKRSSLGKNVAVVAPWDFQCKRPRYGLIVVTNLRDIAHQIHAHIGADTQITQAKSITT